MKKQFDKIVSAPKRIVTHVYDRRGRYGAAAGIITGAVVTRKFDSATYRQAIAFIRLKGLEHEFFHPMDDFEDMV